MWKNNVFWKFLFENYTLVKLINSKEIRFLISQMCCKVRNENKHFVYILNSVLQL
jgi:hypothetical protein